jgi:outer membrane protein OmpA-like peptidoglycan-associated protein/opacity protein-like surface antigen
MKKKLLTFFMVSSLLGSAFAQDVVVVNETVVVEEAQNEGGNYAVGTTYGGPEGVNRFSLGLKGGIDYLRWSDQKVKPEFGGFLEITVNPIWGFGLEYMYMMNDRETLGGGAPGKLNSTVQDVTLFGSLNISNIIAKHRSLGWQKVSLYANAGAGASIYDWSVKNTNRKGSDAAFVALAGLGLEYNVAKWLGLGLEGQYRFHTNNEYIGKGNGGRSILGANLAVRFKFGGHKNVRNITLLNYEPQVEIPAPVDQAALDQQFAEATEKLERQVAAQNAEIQRLQSQVKETKDTVNALKERLKTPVKYIPTSEETAIIKTAFSQLEFETGKSVIKPSSHSSLDGLATLLKQHPEWSVILKGYTDSTGNADKNVILSKDRAAAVKTYLVGKGVSERTIETFGYGAANPIATNSTAAGRAQNRRVEIELFSK